MPPHYASRHTLSPFIFVMLRHAYQILSPLVDTIAAAIQRFSGFFVEFSR